MSTLIQNVRPQYVSFLKEISADQERFDPALNQQNQGGVYIDNSQHYFFGHRTRHDDQTTALVYGITLLFAGAFALGRLYRNLYEFSSRANFCNEIRYAAQNDIHMIAHHPLAMHKRSVRAHLQTLEKIHSIGERSLKVNTKDLGFSWMYTAAAVGIAVSSVYFVRVGLEVRGMHLWNASHSVNRSSELGWRGLQIFLGTSLVGALTYGFDNAKERNREKVSIAKDADVLVREVTNQVTTGRKFEKIVSYFADGILDTISSAFHID